MNIFIRKSRGLSLIEVLIVFAVTASALAYTFPKLTDQAIRAKVSQGLSLAEPAKEALEKTCADNQQAIVHNNLDADYFYVPSGSDDDYLNRVLLGADCASQTMVIVLWTGNTGAVSDPIIELSLNGTDDTEVWTCRVIRGDTRHVPTDCQTAYEAI
jgi:type IV pilus assembly protein PilA